MDEGAATEAAEAAAEAPTPSSLPEVELYSCLLLLMFVTDKKMHTQVRQAPVLMLVIHWDDHIKGRCARCGWLATHQGAAKGGCPKAAAGLSMAMAAEDTIGLLTSLACACVELLTCA
jgi:hypothetical protein